MKGKPPAKSMPKGVPPKGMPPPGMPPKGMGEHRMPNGMMMPDAAMAGMHKPAQGKGGKKGK